MFYEFCERCKKSYPCWGEGMELIRLTAVLPRGGCETMTVCERCWGEMKEEDNPVAIESWGDTAPTVTADVCISDNYGHTITASTEQSKLDDPMMPWNSLTEGEER